MNAASSFAHLSNDDVLAVVKRLAAREREATTRLIAGLMEVDQRRLYLGEGCSSLFTYCTQVLHLSEHAAYGRIAAARAARRFPLILERLESGELTLTAVGLLAPHLTPANHLDLLTRARHRSKREIEHLVACLQPRPDVPSSVRKLPAPKPVATVEAGRPTGSASAKSTETDSAGFGLTAGLSRTPAVLAPLAPERYKVQFTVNRETYDKLRQAQDLLRHTIPDGDPAAVIDRALTLLVAELMRARMSPTHRPRPSRRARPDSRHIPAAVRRAVWTRDAGRCAFVGTHGRCTETGFLEFHHVVPFARGGPAVAENIALRCAAHNAHEAAVSFGSRATVVEVGEAAPYALT
jgi:hypothetical protein